jgi:hypothetical protein
MANRSLPIAGAALASAGVTCAAAAWARRRWESATGDVGKRLSRANRERLAVYRERELDGLPDAVRRYFSAVLKDGQRMVAHARVASQGMFNMGNPSRDAWKPFTAVQDFYPGAPGFVWDARVRMYPGLNIFVRDAFVEGEGSMNAWVAGLVPIVRARGTRDLAEGALMRYLAEAPWFPTALLPRDSLRWSPLTLTSARATLTACGTTASLDFHFDGDGLIASCGGVRQNDQWHRRFPWGGRYTRWVVRDGMVIPSEAEVSWELPSREFSYWRGYVQPTYDYAPQADAARAA